MKKSALLIITILASAMLFGQQTGYYNGTDGKDGEALKTALNDIIKGHTPYSYFSARDIFKRSDADPVTPGNIIQVYTGFSYDNGDYGNSGLQLNREHVWAKSHGDFADEQPMDGDMQNLKPSASTVNQSKSNLDFDNGGVQHSVATGCYYTDSTWEARDEVKGDIARIIFYMSTRYEGNDGELDLEVVDRVNTYPLPEHGKLSTLLEWNFQDPPDEFERNRNNVIYAYQKNRNPFIDEPNFAELIWGGGTASPIGIDNMQISSQIVNTEEPVNIQGTITTTSSGTLTAKLRWGLNHDNLSNEISMTNDGDVFSAIIPGQAEDATVYYKVVATDDINEHSSVVYSFYVLKVFTGTITSIYDIQGQQDKSPYEGQVVSTTGIVTANFSDSYFIQDGFGEWNGLFIYPEQNGKVPSVGDSIVLTGEIVEYWDLTEMKNITDYYFVSSDNTLPDALVVQTGLVEEAHEGVLVKVNNALCTDANYQADHFMWKVNDGSGELKIHNTSTFEFKPTEGISYNITGPMKWDFEEWKIELRFESDVADGTDADGPTVVEVTPVINTNIRVMYNEAVETTTAENVANYTLNNGGFVESAVQHAVNKTQVNLTVAPLEGDYELTVQNVEDESGNVMEPQTIPFSYLSILEQLFNGEPSVYPNPASDRLTVSFDAKEEFVVEISITDMNGRQLRSEKQIVSQGINNLSFNLESYERGTYFFNLNSEKGNLSYKLIIR